MRAALIGCGKIAKMHVSALAGAGVELVAVCDRDQQRATQIAALAPGARAYGDVDALLADMRPDVVHVLTSPSSHAALAIKAAQAGAHVLVEKPVALSVEEADAMIDAARANGVRVMANHNWLFKPSVQRARELVESGEIGEVVHVEAYYGLTDESAQFAAAGGAHWAYRLPGGVFTNYLPHLVYVQDEFLGGIESVAGVTVGRDPHADDQPSELTALVQGRRANGVMTVSIRARPYARYLRIFGTKGIVHADLASEVTTVNRQRRLPRLVTKVLFNLEVVPQLAVGTVVNSAKVATGAMRNMPDLHTFVAELYRALADGQEPPTSADDGRTVVRVMEQIWERMPEPAHCPSPPAPAARPDPRTPVERTIVADGGIRGRVLVTGAAGYLGRHVALALVRCGADVRALVRDPAGVPRDIERDTEVVTANLVDADSVRAAMRDVDLVVHCAALTTNNVPWSLHEETNIRGTRSVVDAAREAGARRLVHVSSVIVYGLDSPSDMPRTEASPLPTAVDRWAFYQRSKLEAERALTNGTPEPSPEIVVVRPGIIYGPGAEAPLKKGLVQLGSTRLTIGRGTNHLPLTYVDNVVDGILLALVSPAAAGQAYNLVDEPQPEIRTAALQAAAVVGEPIRLLPVSSTALEGIARFVERRRESADADLPPRLSRFQIASATRDVLYDVGKARRELGWSSAVGLGEGLQRTFAENGN
jgi:predicted dehydrogenase/nucleoside-diphosphate-sugar epimerase